jgi:hypothetical protein
MKSYSFRRTSSSALALLGALPIALGLSAYAADKKAAPGSVLVADKGKFNILLDGASIGREEFEIEPSGATWTAKGSTSMKTPDGKSSKVTGTLTLQPDGAPLSYDWAAQTEKSNSAHILFVNGVAKTTLQMQGAAPYQQENSFGSPLIAVLDNNLYHQFEILAHIYDWNKKGAQTLPVLIPQELTPGTISVESTGTAAAGGKSYEGLKATTSDLEILLYLDSSHKLIRLEVPSAKVAVVRE